MLGLCFVATETTLEQPTASLRINRTNPNHHLWNNNGVWWIHLTIHFPDYTKLRLRRSLQTGNISIARRLRDRYLDVSQGADLLAGLGTGAQGLLASMATPIYEKLKQKRSS